MLEQFEAEVPAEGFEDAREHLETFFDHALPDDVGDERAEFAAAMTELRAQAPHDEAFREQFTRTDRSLRDHVADIVRDGVEEGVFRDVDPEQTAAFVTATVHGARNVRATTDDEEAVLAARRALREYVEEHLVAEDAEH